MILYKYLSFEGGMKVLESNTIGLTRPCDFNDPFELSAAVCKDESSDPYEMISQMSKEKNFNFFWERAHQWRRKCCILSLTRQPLNPLMWSHYGDNYKGMVIGIDCSAGEFTSKKHNVVPVQFGNVIYSNSKPKNDVICNESEEREYFSPFHFPANNLERLQRLFLYKESQWAHEEEVRLVKYLGSRLPADYSFNVSERNEHAVTDKASIESLNQYLEPNEELHSIVDRVIECNGRPLFLLNLPPNSIKEVYVGARTSILQSGDATNAINFSQTVNSLQPKAKIFGCYVEDSSWSIQTFNVAEKLSQKR